MVKLPDFIRKFAESHPDIYGFITDLLFSLAVVAVIAVALYLYAGMWPPMVAVNGISMTPHMHDGDLVFIQGLDRGDIRTYQASLNDSYSTYGEPGDVIVYRPEGDPSRALVIHRAMYWVDQGKPMWPGGPAAPWSGYITKGDNNPVFDQDPLAVNISPLEPVRKEWIIGISRFKLPYLGYLRSIVPGLPSTG